MFITKFLSRGFHNLILRQGPQELLRKKLRLPKDRYGIAKTVDIQFLYKLIRKPPEDGFTINQLIVLSFRIAELSQVEKHRVRTIQFSWLLDNIFRRLENPEDYPSIGRLALGMYKVKLMHTQGLAVIADCIVAKKYDDQFDQVFAALMAFVKFKQNADIQQSWLLDLLRCVFKELQIALAAHIRDLRYNFPTVKYIADVMFANGANQAQFWQSVLFFAQRSAFELEKKSQSSFFVAKIQSFQKRLFDYKRQEPRLLEDFTEMAYYLTRNELPSARIMRLIDKLISLEEIGLQFTQNFKQKDDWVLLKPWHLDDQHLAYLIQVIFQTQAKTEYKKASNTIKTIEVRLQDCTLSLRGILAIYRARKILFSDVRPLLQKKLFELDVSRNDYNLNDVLAVLHLYADEKGGYQEIPYQIIGFCEDLARRKVAFVQGKQLLQFIKQLEAKNLLKKLKSLCEVIPSAVNSLSNYYTFQENCYVFYVMKSNESFWGQLSPRFQSGMQSLKDSIKLSVNTRGFKMDLNSYFYKLLTQIDNVSFFDGG